MFGDAVKSVSVMEGESVTLHTDEIQKEDLFVWTFGPDNIVMAINSEIRIFKDRLLVNQPTGSLTINNITAHFSGIYKLEIPRKTLITTFNVTVYGE